MATAEGATEYPSIVDEKTTDDYINEDLEVRRKDSPIRANGGGATAGGAGDGGDELLIGKHRSPLPSSGVSSQQPTATPLNISSGSTAMTSTGSDFIANNPRELELAETEASARQRIGGRKSPVPHTHGGGICTTATTTSITPEATTTPQQQSSPAMTGDGAPPKQKDGPPEQEVEDLKDGACGGELQPMKGRNNQRTGTFVNNELLGATLGDDDGGAEEDNAGVVLHGSSSSSLNPTTTATTRSSSGAQGRNSRNSGGLMSATIVALRRTPDEIIAKQRLARGRSQSNSPRNPSSSNNPQRESTSSAIVTSTTIGQDVISDMLGQPSPSDNENSVEGNDVNRVGGRRAPAVVGAIAVNGARSPLPKSIASMKEKETPSVNSGGRKSYLSYVDDAGDQHKQPGMTNGGPKRNSYLSYLEDMEANQQQQQQQQEQQPQMTTLSRHQSAPGAFHAGIGTEDSSMDQQQPELTTLTMDQSDPGAFHSGEFNESGGDPVVHPESEQAPNHLDEDTQNQLAQMFPSSNALGAAEDDSSVTGLSVAMLINSEELADLETATHMSEMDISRMSNSRKSVKQEGRRWLPWIILALVILVGLMLGCFFLGLHFGEKRATTTTVTASPSSSSPSASPSAAPTGALDMLRSTLPEPTLESLDTFDTPQWRAWDWLENHPDLLVMEEWRKQQLFALVTFYHSMAGDSWPQAIRDNWLLYDRSDCFWFDTVFGEFNEATGLWEAQTYYDDDGDVVRTVCNEQDEFQLLDLVGLELAGYNPFIPPEMSLLTSLAVVSLPKNGIDVPLADFLPSEVYVSNISIINLNNNSLSGFLPTEMGKMSDLLELLMFGNDLSGQLPSELGSMTRMKDLDFDHNSLNGSIPSELGLMTSMIWLYLTDNRFTGQLPSELGRWKDAKNLMLNLNALSGSLPSELALLPALEKVRLENNFLTGVIPPEFESLRTNGSLTTLSLANNSLSGTIPEGLCSLGVFVEDWGVGLSFDCNEQLCGCCWCPCAGSNYSNGCETSAFIPSRDDVVWPGAFPVPANISNAITINIRADRYPEETTFEWSVQEKPGVWKLLESNNPPDKEDLNSYTYEVTSDSVYRLKILDEYGDGNCCALGFGWFTITNSIPSDDHVNGTVIWEAAGFDLDYELEVFLSIDPNGQAQLLEDQLVEDEMEPSGLAVETHTNSSLETEASGLASTSNLTHN